MNTTRDHISQYELLAYAQSGYPAQPAFRHIARHLGHGCPDCEARLAELDPIHGGRPAAPEGWVQARRYRVTGNVRAGALADVSLLCCAGAYELDVVVRELTAPPSLAVSGCVSLADRIQEPVSGLDLSLVEPESRGVVATTTTDEDGEFEFPVIEECHVGLRCGLESTSPIVLLWDGCR